MAKTHGKISKKFGLKPGSVVYVGQERTEDVHIDIIDYTDSELHEVRVSTVEDCFPYRDKNSTTWINITGIHNVELVQTLGSHFELHDLVLEDVVNTGQRPKLEETPAHFFIVLKMLYLNEHKNKLKSEQISILFGKNWVITFQETPEDVFDMVRNRIRKTIPRVRFMHADYLAYALLDAVVDNYFIVLEQLGEDIENLDDAVSFNPEQVHLKSIRILKKQLLNMRRAVWPLREVIGGLERTESKLIHDTTGPYIRDLYEHTIQVIDTVETYRDMISGLLDLYHTGIANRMNDIMKVLTIIATVFIPLGFLAGVYGMNFDTSVSVFNLPELGFKYGYPMFWGMVVLVAGGLVWFFKRKKWL